MVNKNGDVITAAVTGLDIHDISRAAKTYGARSFFVVTPLEDQRALVQRLVSHWVTGYGARYNPKRREALELIRIKNTLDEVVDHIRRCEGKAPKTVVTSARGGECNISFGRFREMLGDGSPYLLIFGTGWGLTKAFIDRTDYTLDPVTGSSGYNHLSVRSAAAIILDRLFGRCEITSGGNRGPRCSE